jgi:hypothetical protein
MNYNDYTKCGVRIDGNMVDKDGVVVGQLKNWSRVESNCDINIHKKYTSSELNKRRKQEILKYKKNKNIHTKINLFSYISNNSRIANHIVCSDIIDSDIPLLH